MKLNRHNESLKVFLISFFISLCVFSLWLIAFYPGTMSYDSFIQWQQARGLKGLTNNIPYIHTLFVRYLTYFWHSPAMLGIFQILLSSAIISYLMFFLYKKNVNSLLLFCTFLFYIFSPVIGIYNVTLWKDVIYSQLLFLFAILFVRDFVSKQENKKEFHFSYAKIFVYSALLFFMSLVRHNGFIYLFAIPVIYLANHIVSLRKFAFFFLCLIALFSFMSAGIKNSVGVQKGPSLSRVIAVGMIAGIVKMGGEVSIEDKQFIEQFIPLSSIKSRYRCSCIDHLLYYNPAFKSQKFIEGNNFFKQFDLFTLKFIFKNLPYFIAERFCIFSHLIGLGRNDHFYYTDMIENYITESLDIKQEGCNFLKNNLRHLLIFSTKNAFCKAVFWTPFTYICIFIIFALIGLYKHNKLVLSYCLIFLISVATIFLTTPCRDYRYFYMLHLGIIPIFAVYSLSSKLKSEQ